MLDAHGLFDLSQLCHSNNANEEILAWNNEIVLTARGKMEFEQYYGTLYANSKGLIADNKAFGLMCYSNLIDEVGITNTNLILEQYGSKYNIPVTKREDGRFLDFNSMTAL